MRYLVIFVILAVAVWYFLGDHSAEPVQKPTPTAEQAVRTVVSSDPVDAAQLASICARFPQLTASLLNGRQIRVKGSVEGMRVSGMDGRRAEIWFSGDLKRKVVLVCDLDQYKSSGVDVEYLGRFQVVGTELLYVVDDPHFLRRVVCQTGDDMTRIAALVRMGVAEATFRMVDGSSWVKPIPRGSRSLQHRK